MDLGAHARVRGHSRFVFQRGDVPHLPTQGSHIAVGIILVAWLVRFVATILTSRLAGKATVTRDVETGALESRNSETRKSPGITGFFFFNLNLVIHDRAFAERGHREGELAHIRIHLAAGDLIGHQVVHRLLFQLHHSVHQRSCS